VTALQGLTYGLSVAASPENLLAALLGAILGTAIGVLPGLGPLAGMALVLPITFSLPPVTGLIALAGMFYGAMYGGSTTSILMNIPGESASVVTLIDGYQMTRRGRAGAALTIVALGSFVAGTLSIFGVMVFSRALATAGFSFGPPEFFALTTAGLLVLSRIARGSFPRALFATSLGLVLSTVGVDAVSGVRRYDFGVLEASTGVDLVPAAVGLFGIAEIVLLVERGAGTIAARTVRLRELFPTRDELRRSVPAWARGTVIGFFIGVLPGPAAIISTFASYWVEKTVSRRKDEFGHGAVEGVAGPEAANNAAATSAFIPLLSLGVPFSPILAIVLAAMIVQGVSPGPLLLVQNPEIFWGVMASMYVGNLMLLILNLPLVGVWVSLLRIPPQILITCIALFAIVGAYSVRNSPFDLWVLLAFGGLGYLLRKMDIDMTPLVLALVLGPLIEKHLRESLFLSRGELAVFVTRPVSLVIWVVTAAILVGDPILRMLRRRRRGDARRSPMQTDVAR
jgi:putative tricarboxylic transport membrane protein